MTRTTLFAAAMLSALPFATLSVSALADEGDGSRMDRSWTHSGSAGSTSARTHTRNPAPSPVRDTPTVRDAGSYANTSNSDDDGDGNDRGFRRHGRYQEGGLDPDEAARIRRAHEDSDGHVYMRRDRDDDEYGTRSYRSGYSTTYRRNWEAPRHRRHHWWRSWW